MKEVEKKYVEYLTPVLFSLLCKCIANNCFLLVKKLFLNKFSWTWSNWNWIEYTARLVILGFLVTHVLPLSPGQSQILNWNVLLPHKLLWPFKYWEIWESGKRGTRRFFISNQWDYWETEGGWWIMSPVITKQKGLFLVQLFYALKVVMGFFFIFFVIGAFSSFIMFIQIKKVHSKNETADCIGDTIPLYSKHITL